MIFARVVAHVHLHGDKKCYPSHALPLFGAHAAGTCCLEANNRTSIVCIQANVARQVSEQSLLVENMDPLGIEPRAFRMRSGCDTTTP